MELDHLDTALCLFNPPNTEPPSNEFEVPVLFTLLFSACIWPSCSDDALSLGLVDSFCFLSGMIMTRLISTYFYESFLSDSILNFLWFNL